MDFRKLHYYREVYRHRSLRFAARALGVAQSTLSMALRQLESELGAQLFERVPAGLVPTPAGQALYKDADELLRELVRACFGAAQPPSTAVVVLFRTQPLVPGSRLESAVSFALDVMARTHTALRFKLDYGADQRGATPIALLDYRAALRREDATSSEIVHIDQWALLGAEAPRRNAPSLEPLQGITMIVPVLPRRLAASLQKRLRQAGLFPAEIEERDLDSLSPDLLRVGDTVCMAPASYLPPALWTAMPANRRMLLPEPGLAVRFTGLRPSDEDTLPIDALREALRRGFVASVDSTDSSTGSHRFAVDLRQLRYFLAVCEEKNVTRAANRLHVVQPALSLQLRKLQSALGVILLTRNAAGVSPTAAGLALAKFSRTAVDEMAQLKATVTSNVVQLLRHLQIGVLPALDEESLLSEVLSNAVATWSHVHAKVNLQVTEAYSRTLIRWTLNGTVDLAIIIGAPAKGLPLVSKHLATDTLAIVTSAQSVLVPAGPIPLRSVVGLPLILPSRRHGLRLLIDRALAEQKLRVIPRLELDSMSSAIHLLRKGGWATILPISSVNRRAARGALRINPIVEPAVARDLYLIQRAHEPPSIWAREFVEILSKELARLPI